MSVARDSNVENSIPEDNWFDSWSEGPFTLREVDSMVSSGADPTKFHIVLHDQDQTITYQQYLERYSP